MRSTGFVQCNLVSIVALVSPEFVRGLAPVPAQASVVRYAASLGMIWGLFLGTGVMGFSLLITTLVKLTRALDAGRSREDAPK